MVGMKEPFLPRMSERSISQIVLLVTVGLGRKRKRRVGKFEEAYMPFPLYIWENQSAWYQHINKHIEQHSGEDACLFLLRSLFFQSHLSKHSNFFFFLQKESGPACPVCNVCIAFPRLVCPRASGKRTSQAGCGLPLNLGLPVTSYMITGATSFTLLSIDSSTKRRKRHLAV